MTVSWSVHDDPTNAYGRAPEPNAGSTNGQRVVNRGALRDLAEQSEQESAEQDRTERAGGMASKWIQVVPKEVKMACTLLTVAHTVPDS